MITEWMKNNSWILGILFILVLALVVWARKRFASKVEIKPIDAVVAVIPLVLWMATAGIFKKVEVPGVLAFETGDVIRKAAEAPIKLQVSSLPVKPLKADPKVGVQEIPRLMATGTEALSFRLGYGGYYGPAIWMYMSHLIRSLSFRYVVIVEANGSLFGIFEASRLITSLTPPNNDELMKNYPLQPFRGLPNEAEVSEWTEFAKNIRDADKTRIQQYSGFVSSTQAVSPDSDKRQVLERMEKSRVNWLPVISEDKSELVGVVERSRITASLILDVANQLQAQKAEANKVGERE